MGVKRTARPKRSEYNQDIAPEELGAPVEDVLFFWEPPRHHRHGVRTIEADHVAALGTFWERGLGIG